jgi:hypothetical protein
MSAGPGNTSDAELTPRCSGTDDDTDVIYPAPDWKPEPRPA